MNFHVGINNEKVKMRLTLQVQVNLVSYQYACLNLHSNKALSSTLK